MSLAQYIAIFSTDSSGWSQLDGILVVSILILYFGLIIYFILKEW